MESSKKSTIEKLNDSNSYTWFYQMEMLLKSKRLWQHTDEWSMPEEFSFTATTTTPMGDDDDEEVKEKEFKKKKKSSSIDSQKWQVDDHKALALIGISVEPKFYGIIKSSKSCSDAWRSLKNHFCNAFINLMVES